MKSLLVAGLAGLVFGAVALRRRRRKPATAVEKIEQRVTEIKGRAKRLSGEAKQRLLDEAHELEAQQRELKKRLDDLTGDAQKVFQKAKSLAHARSA